MTTHTTPIDLRPFHGRECEATIGEHILSTEKGKISVSKIGSVFFFNNNRGGSINSEEIENFGYSREWIVQSYHESKWDDTQLKSITLLDEPKPINPEWDWKDGEIVRLNNREYKVCKIHDDIVVFIVDGRSTGSYTNQEAYIKGWRKLPPQPQRNLVEITEEMFRSTAWYGKKVMYNGVEQGVYVIHYNRGRFVLTQSGEQHYSQCKLIEE